MFSSDVLSDASISLVRMHGVKRPATEEGPVAPLIQDTDTKKEKAEREVKDLSAYTRTLAPHQ